MPAMTLIDGEASRAEIPSGGPESVSTDPLPKDIGARLLDKVENDGTEIVEVQGPHPTDAGTAPDQPAA